MKTYTLPVIGLMTLGASAFAAAAPSTGNSLPARDNFSACKWLGDRFKWFNSERDHKNPYIQEFNVSLRMQYGRTGLTRTAKAASWEKRKATAAASTMNGAASAPGST
ncbi:MAG: hypothetical protein ACLRPT_01315 [Akkermansia muciniphila]